MNARKLALVICLVGLAADLVAPAAVGAPAAGGASTGSSREEAGDRLWRERARGFASKELDPKPTEGAMEAWEEALVARPESLELRFKLMEAIYFRANFLGGSSIEPKVLYERLVDLAEETVELAVAGADATELARAHFWAAVGWVLWGQSHGSVKSGTRGVAGKIRRHAQDLIELDPEFANAGGMRLLGRLHTVAPKVPFFTGWIDREVGIELLREAHGISTRDGRNALFLAEALLEYHPQEKRLALELLVDVCQRQPDPAQLVEDSETIDAACRSLAKAGGGERP